MEVLKKVVTENARRMELFLDTYRRADGEVWKGTEIHRATDQTVSSSYLTAIRKGGIKQPSDKYRRAITNAMGFPFEYWFMDVGELKRVLKQERRGGGAPPPPKKKTSKWAKGEELAGLIGDQVALAMLDRGVGELTDRDLSEEIEGRLTEEELRRMRAGGVETLVGDQTLALSDLFGTEPGYSRVGPPRRDLITLEAAARILRHRAG